jgi:hypothetical protein
MAELTGWIDYDRPHLASLSPTDRISYLEKRTRLVALNPLRRILTLEVHPKDTSGNPVENSSALLILGVAICCSIESLGKFLNGSSGGNHVRFKAFLHKYMNPDFQSQSLGSDTYGEILWKYFRNGIAHGFAVCHGGYEGGAGSPYFVVNGSMLEINPTLLLDDLSQAFDNYLVDLRACSDSDALFLAFNAVFEDVFINGN